MVALCAVTFFINLGGTHLWEEDEAYFGRTAREMLDRGDYIVPFFNGEISLHKPVLMYWVIMAGFAVFGENEFAARFGSTLFGIGNVLLTYHLGRKLFSAQAGFWCALVLGTCLHFVVVSRAAVADPELVFFCTLPLLIFVSGTRLSRTRAEQQPVVAGQPVLASELSWAGWAGIYASMGAATLTKGPVGFVLPTAVMGLFLLLSRADQAGEWAAGRMERLKSIVMWLARVLWPTTFLKTVWSMRPLTAIVMLSLVALPWYVAVGYQTNGEWPRGFFFVHNVGRFVNSFESHRGGPLYYVVAICIGMFPWCMFNYQALHLAWTGLRVNGPARPAYQLLLAWVFVWVGAFTFAGTKLPHYIMPAYPALALIFGAFVEHWLSRRAEISIPWQRAAWMTLIIVGVGLLIGLPIAAMNFAPGEEILGVLGLIPLAGGLLGWRFEEQGRRDVAARMVVGLGATFSIALLAWGAVRIDQHQKSHVVAGWVQDLATEKHPRLAAMGCFEASLAYYCDDTIKDIGYADLSTLFADDAPETYVITTSRQLKAAGTQIPEGVTVLRETPRFLRPESLVLLGRPTHSTVGATSYGTKSVQAAVHTLER